jgi:hypothetical protein
MNGHAEILIKFTDNLSDTINMYEPEYDDHSSDYAEERHNAECEARDIDQGIQTEI